MATVQRFEDLVIWKLARELSREVYGFTTRQPFVQDHPLKNQIRASSGSVMDNIAEGFERGSRKEFIQFLTIAKGSAGETRSQLYRSCDLQYLTQEEFEATKNKCLTLSKMLYSFIEQLKKSEISGIRYKVQKSELPFGSSEEILPELSFQGEEDTLSDRNLM